MIQTGPEGLEDGREDEKAHGSPSKLPAEQRSLPHSSWGRLQCSADGRAWALLEEQPSVDSLLGLADPAREVFLGGSGECSGSVLD